MILLYGGPDLPLDLAGPPLGETVGGVGLGRASVVAVICVLRAYRKNKSEKNRKR